MLHYWELGLQFLETSDNKIVHILKKKKKINS